MIDEWFLNKLLHLVRFEEQMQKETLTQELYHEAKVLGYPDKAIERISGQRDSAA